MNQTDLNSPSTEETDDKRDRGAVAVIVAITLMPLMLVAAYATDLGFWLNRSQQMQRAADLAALAGAAEMPNPYSAEAIAVETLRRNGFNVCPGVGCDPNLTADVTFPNPGQISVSVNDASVPAFLADPVTGDIAMSRIATSTYLPELALGSPSNRFGAEAVPVDAADQQLVASISGLGIRIADGSPYETCPGEVPVTWDGCSPGINPVYDGRGFFYAIDVKEAGLITVDLFDANFDATGGCDFDANACDIGGGTSWVTYDVYNTDSTPWTWEDNEASGTVPQAGATPCRMAIGPGMGAAMKNSWTTLCQFNAAGPGIYVLNVRSSSYLPWAVAEGATAFGDDRSIYNYSVRATSSSATAPQVYGFGSAGFFSGVKTDRDGSYWLASVDEAYEGKTLQFDIFDPGELPPNTWLMLMEPSNTTVPSIGGLPNRGSLATCSWVRMNHPKTLEISATTVDQPCRIQISDAAGNSMWDGEWLRIETTVQPGYQCSDAAFQGNCFWWMQIDLDNTITPVESDTEKSVFTATVLGDPIRLVG